jgi:hypothetical protein
MSPKVKASFENGMGAITTSPERDFAPAFAAVPEFG